MNQSSEYLPSETIVMFAINNTLASTTTYKYEDIANNEILFKGLQDQIGGSLIDFLKNLVYEVEQGEEVTNLPIIENGQFNPELLPVLYCRLPVNAESREEFYKLLANDLQKWVYTPKKIGQDSLLLMVDNNIILMNTKAGVQPIHSSWKKANQFIPKS